MKHKDKIKLFKIFKMYLKEADEIEDFKVHNNEFYVRIKVLEEK